MDIHENLTILNCKGETISEGKLDELSIVVDAMSDIKVSSVTADVDYLDHEYMIIVLDTQITQNDIFKTMSKYIKTLSIYDKKKITD